MTSRAPPDSVLFLARSLNRGGAERQIVELAKRLTASSRRVCVAVFFSGGPLEKELRGTGVELIDLKKRGWWDIARFLIRLVRVIRRENPTILHSYLTVPNILAVLIKPFLPGTRIVWGIRATDLDLSLYDWTVRFTLSAERLLSRWADLIIANSEAGQRDAVRQGFPRDRIVVVPNGIDVERFSFSATGREAFRSAWGIQPTEVLIGVVARLDPMKDHAHFLHAATRVAQQLPSARFIIVGEGPPDYLRSLRELPEVRALAHRLVWAGAVDDMPGVYSALDVAVSPSRFGEGFSNAVAEAMACERPCVVTEVGDSRSIVAGTGSVIPPGDVDALSGALLSVASLPAAERHLLGAAARDRIRSQFSGEALLARTLHALGLN